MVTLTWSVSTTTPYRGEIITFSYEFAGSPSYSEIENFLFEILPQDNTEPPFKIKRFTHPNGEISFQCPYYTCSLVAMVYDTRGQSREIVLEQLVLEVSRGPPLSKRLYIADPTAQSSEPVAEGIALNLISPNYFGYPQKIAFDRLGGARENVDYMEFHLNHSRLDWHWCRNRTSMEFDVSQADARGGLITVTYMEITGYAKTKLKELNYVLVDPVRQFQASKRLVQVGEVISISYQLVSLPPFCAIILRYEGIEVHHQPLQSYNGSCRILCPRLPGACEVACVALEDGSIVLAMETILVTDPLLLSSSFSLDFPSLSDQDGIYQVPPSTVFHLVAEGTLLYGQDEIRIIKEQNSGGPSHETIQSPYLSHVVGESGSVPLCLREAGVYHVCLGLKQTRLFLLAAYRTITVAGEPPPPLPLEAEEEATASSLPPLPPDRPQMNMLSCVICLDAPVSMLLYPCRHVCVCQNCVDTMKSKGSVSCPLCRGTVTREERVFLP